MKTTHLNFRAFHKKKQRAGKKTRKPSALAGSIAAVAASLLTLSALPSEAATYSWLPTGAGPFAWDDTANWQPNTGFPNAQDDIAILSLADLTANQVINMTAAITIGTLQLGDALGSSVYTLAAGGGSLTFDVSSGSALLFKNHGGLNITSLAGMDTISTGVTLNSNLVINNALAGQGINITGVIDDGIFTRGITKDGAGFVQLSGVNTFDGGVTINAGRLAVSLSSAAAGTSGTITLNTGAQFDILNDTALTVANTFEIRGNSIINVDRAIGGGGSNQTHTISGPLTLNNDTLLVTAANGFGLLLSGDLNLAGAVSTISNGTPTVNVGSATGGKITGTGALNKVGGATLVLANTSATANDYSGGTNVFAGVLQLNFAGGTGATMGSGAVYIAPNAILRISDTSNLTGPSQIAIQSTVGSVVNVSQGPTGPTSTTTAGNAPGVLELGANFAIGTSANGIYTSPVIGAALRTNQGSITNAVDMSQLGNHAAGNGRFWLGAGATATYSGAISADTDGILRLGTNNAAGTVMTISSDLTFANGITNGIIIGHTVSNIVGATGGMNGTVTLSGTGNNYTGSTTVNRFAGGASTLQITSTADVQDYIPQGSQVNLFGQLLFSGAYNVAATLPQQTFTNPVNIMNTAFTNAVGQNVGLVLNNNAYTTSATQPRLAGTTALNLSSGNFRFLGSTTAAQTTIQNLATINFEGGNLIEISRGVAATDNARINLTDLNRSNAGSLGFVTTGGTMGATDTRFMITNLNGGAIGTPALLPAWLVDHTGATTFVGYNATGGVTPITYASTNILTSTAANTVNQTATAAIVGSNALALRVNGDFGLTGTGAITIGASAPVGDPAGLIFTGTLTADRTHTNNWIFGTAGNREAMIWDSHGGAFVEILSGSINATGLTKAGTSTLSLTGDSRGTVAATPLLTGTVTINQGSLRFATPNALGVRLGANTTAATTTPYVVDAPAIRLAGGTLDVSPSTAAAGNFLSAITVINDSAILSNTTPTLPRFGSLTFAARTGGAPDPTVLTLTGGQVYTGTVTLNQSAAFNLLTTTSGVNATFLQGQVTGAGAIQKWGPGTLVLTNGAGAAATVAQNNYSGGTVVNQGILVSTAGSLGDTPFGSGLVTVNPGGTVRLAHPTNTVTGGLTVNSDLTGLGVVGLAYSGALPAITFNNGTNGGPFNGVIAVDVLGFDTAINQGTIGSGTSFLGSSAGINAGTGVTASGAANFTGTLTDSSGVYRIGGGGGVLNMNGPTNSAAPA